MKSLCVCVCVLFTDPWVFGLHAGSEVLQTEWEQRFYDANVRTSREQEDGEGREEASVIHDTVT